MEKNELINSIDKNLKELWNSIIEAEGSYEILNTMFKLQYNSNVYNRYYHFFNALKQALYASIVMSLFRIYDTKKTKSLSGMLKQAEKFKLINSKKLDNLNAKVTKNAQIIHKIEILRHNYYAHLQLSPDKAYDMAKIKSTHFRDAIKLTKTLIESFSKALNEHSYIYDSGGARDHAGQIMLILKSNLETGKNKI